MTSDHESIELERMPLPIEELRIIADLTVRLTELRQRECKHLCIERFAPELWRNLLMVTYPPPKMIVEGGDDFREEVLGAFAPAGITGDAT